MNYLVPVQCGAPDYNKNYLKLIKTNANKFSSIKNINQLSYHLAGIWEGDGHIGIPKTTHSPSGKKYYPNFCITFASKNKPLAELYKKFLVKIDVKSSIRLKKEDNAVVLIISSCGSLINLVNFINGKIRTPKIYEFHLLINWLNNNLDCSLALLDKDTSKLEENAWLAGFIDADGHFKIRYQEKRLEPINSRVLKKGRIEIRFSLEQRMVHPKTKDSFVDIMKQIANFFTVNLNKSKHNLKFYYIVEVTSPTKLKIMINYLNKYSLLSTKNLDFKDWCVIYQLILENKHITLEGKQITKKVKANMNKNRIIFDWKHLDVIF